MKRKYLNNRRIRQCVNKQDGFTLIELMIVIAIIGILVTISAPVFAEQLDKARYGKAEAELKSRASLLALYFIDELQYPAEGTEGAAGAYEELMTGNGIDVNRMDPWDNEYVYSLGTDSKSFTLTSLGSDNANGVEEGSDQWAQDIVFSGDANGVIIMSYVDDPQQQNGE